ncbi:ATP-dependent Clp protease proteolytic subunit [Streptomyces sp. NPDC085946]|uniref:ATP-dependent Clp protease proteolytic subunit n=1 Tax=Streptomyces sp. NPDC085946 TaxID=3365744 RepID=UPI0037D79BD7
MIRPPTRHALPESTEGAAAGHRAADPYAKPPQERVVLLGTRPGGTAAHDATARFPDLAHADPGRDVSPYVTSPGGSFHAMAAVYDTVRSVGCGAEPVRPGRGGATAAAPPAAGTPGKRPVPPGAGVVLRQPGPADRAGEARRVRACPQEMPARHTDRARERGTADTGREKALDAREAAARGPAARVVPDRAGARPAPGGR